ncbi:glycosyltransferase family 2 protein [Agriterribacter sp.]|uniref:glycosyltransferase family 2 protein n=1 Tax=Agriterribacter sp. TaxID=2821509 RepID=UPI002C8E82FA|nr:glycosyltransferase family 2 protein [Agriterribacter sp.]HRO44901.1 glycosyltransferase family 2 protein [Agriterribacter sp.]HRQ15639.1 glycosyltransferase family 2 protein [Agriterribacter sp.]
MPQSNIIVLSVIIVNYNVKYFLEQCLFSVYKAGQHIAMEVIVVDNFSSDGSRAYLEPAFPEATFYWNKENLGFAKACNLGLKHAKGEYILFLNPDTIVGEDCFERCIDFLRSHTQSGALGVRMIDESGSFLKESKRAFPSPAASFFKLSGLAGLFPRSGFFAKYYLGNLDEFQTHEADVIAGAFMMIKKNILDITGGFDEAFFMYGEDIDLSYRIQKQGYKNYYYPGVTILHFKGKSTPQKNIRYVRMFYGAMRVFVNKHYGKRKAGVYNFCIQTAIWLRGAIAHLLYLVQNNVNAIKKRNLESALEVLIIGEEERYNQVLTVMNDTNSRKTRRIGILPGEQNVTKNLSTIKDILKRHHIRNIVVCEGEQSFAEIIKLTGLLDSRGVRIGIHAAGSKGITGGLHAGNDL